MSKHVSEDRLALYLSGDLPVREANGVADHLRNCADCQASLTAFEEMRNLLGCSQAEPELCDLYEVRQRVTSQLVSQATAKRWVWGVAGGMIGVAALLVLLFAVREPPRRTDGVQLVAQLPLRVTLPAPRLIEIATLHRHVTRTRPAGLRSVALITRANEPALIRMKTADPNVVILWESNKEGENE
jgi:anti-sigma factor RsiW